MYREISDWGLSEREVECGMKESLRSRAYEVAGRLPNMFIERTQ